LVDISSSRGSRYRWRVSLSRAAPQGAAPQGECVLENYTPHAN
jgi:hypothetical protein